MEKHNRKIIEKGFTLIEVVTAIFLIIVGVVGIMIAVQQVLPSIKIASSQLTAAYLTQEGFEIVRSIRDTNWLKDQEWNMNIFDTCCGCGPVCACDCQADYTNQSLSNFNGTPLKSDGDFYNYTSVTPTPFVRKIRVASTTPNRIEVEVSVSWQIGNKAYQASTTEYLYNWR